jgi:glycopeptide antibiotics resistance protein
MTFLNRNFLWKTAALLYGGTLLYIVFFARRRRGRILFQHSEWNIIPLKNKWHYISNWHGLHEKVRQAFVENALGNIILFIPLSFFLYCLFRVEQFRRNVLLCCGISAGIELIQFITGKGVADIDDIILNTLGAMAGFGLGRVISGKSLEL